MIVDVASGSGGDRVCIPLQEGMLDGSTEQGPVIGNGVDVEVSLRDVLRRRRLGLPRKGAGIVCGGADPV